MAAGTQATQLNVRCVEDMLITRMAHTQTPSEIYIAVDLCRSSFVYYGDYQMAEG